MNLAQKAISDMLEKGEKITVAELVRSARRVGEKDWAFQEDFSIRILRYVRN